MPKLRIAKSMLVSAPHLAAVLDRHVAAVTAATVRALTAAVTGDTDLPVADRDAEWDPAAAQDAVWEWAKDGDGFDEGMLGAAYFYRHPEADGQTRGAWALPFATVADGILTMVPAGVAAAPDALAAMDPQPEDADAVAARICEAYDTIRGTYDDWPACPVAAPEGETEATTAAGCAPCQAAQTAELAAADTAPTDTAAGTTIGWSGPVCIEGVPTGDGRLMDEGSLWWENLPAPLRWDEEDDGFHAGAFVVALIETLERRDGGVIWGTGVVDLVSDNGWKAANMMSRGFLRGVSVDLDSVEFTVSVRADLLGEDDTPLEVGEDGRVVVYEGAADDELMRVTSARVRGATLCDIPAFIDAEIRLDGPLPDVQPTTAGVVDLVASGVRVDMRALNLALTAAAGPQAPPSEWFSDPKLPGPTPLTITTSGRVYGHIAQWGTCHTGYAGQCITPPRSSTGYAFFRTGAVLTAEGTEVATGRISVGTGHPDLHQNMARATAHYDNTGSAVADVAAGEDEWGIWIAGSIRPTATAAQIRALRASPPSGDWRMAGTGQELCHVLAVNMPGFPIPRQKPTGLVASGRVVSLILPGLTAADRASDGLTADERAELRAMLAASKAAKDTAQADDPLSVEEDVLAHQMAVADLAWTMAGTR